MSNGASAPVKEMIGRTGRVQTSFLNRRPLRATTDTTQADYAFFDKAENGLAEGLEISGLFLKPIRSKVAGWVLGEKPNFEIEDAPETQDGLNKWMDTHWHEVLRGYSESVGKGDFYFLINPDLSVTMIPPHIIEPIVDEMDYSKRLGWRTYERINHPTEPGRYQIHINEYYEDRRVQTIESDTQAAIVKERIYPNLIGRNPIIHVPTNKGANQTHGTPLAYPLVSTQSGLLYQYNDLLVAGIGGNIKQGRPTPTLSFEDVEALDKFYREFATEETIGYDENGDPIKEMMVVFDSDKLMMAVGSFDYKQPGAFAGETQILAALLYWIILEYTEIPEFVMGTAIASSKASTETQMPVFERFITLMQGETRGWLQQLAEIVTAYMVARRDVVGAGSEIGVQFKSITSEDGELVLKVLEWLKLNHLIDDEEALKQAPSVQIKDVKTTLRKARQEKKDRDSDQAVNNVAAMGRLAARRQQLQDEQSAEQEQLNPAA